MKEIFSQAVIIQQHLHNISTHNKMHVDYLIPENIVYPTLEKSWGMHLNV